MEWVLFIILELQLIMLFLDIRKYKGDVYQTFKRMKTYVNEVVRYENNSTKETNKEIQK